MEEPDYEENKSMWINKAIHIRRDKHACWKKKKERKGKREGDVVAIKSTKMAISYYGKYYVSCVTLFVYICDHASYASYERRRKKIGDFQILA